MKHRTNRQRRERKERKAIELVEKNKKAPKRYFSANDIKQTYSQIINSVRTKSTTFKIQNWDKGKHKHFLTDGFGNFKELN